MTRRTSITPPGGGAAIPIPRVIKYDTALATLKKRHLDTLQDLRKFIIDFFVSSGITLPQINFEEGSGINKWDTPNYYSIEIYFGVEEGSPTFNVAVYACGKLYQANFTEYSAEKETRNYRCGHCNLHPLTKNSPDLIQCQHVTLSFEELLEKLPDFAQFTKDNIG